MTFSILPAQSSDLSDIATICLDAFQNDPIVGRIWVNCPREANHAWQVRSFTQTYENFERDGVRFMKAVDDQTG